MIQNRYPQPAAPDETQLQHRCPPPGIFPSWRAAAPFLAVAVFGTAILVYWIGLGFGWWGMP